MNTALSREDDKPWKTDLARKSAQRREQVVHEIEEAVRQAPSFEEALRTAVELMKKRFARFAAVTAYVADGEELAVHVAIDRPQGPERVGATGGPLADAAAGAAPVVVTNLGHNETWGSVGLTTGSVMVVPIRTEAGLWAIVEIWSDFREAFAQPDVRLMERLAGALARKTPAA